MTNLSLAVRNTLAQDDRFRTWIPKSESWDIWIFDEKPMLATFENRGKCLIVVNEGAPWTTMNAHNRLYFPTVVVDIWADPTRNPDRSMRYDDAKDKINDITRLVDDHLHRVDNGGEDGGWIVWGTEAQQEARTGIFANGSQRLSGPDFEPIRDVDGAWMGRLTYGVKTA